MPQSQPLTNPIPAANRSNQLTPNVRVNVHPVDAGSAPDAFAWHHHLRTGCTGHRGLVLECWLVSSPAQAVQCSRGSGPMIQCLGVCLSQGIGKMLDTLFKSRDLNDCPVSPVCWPPALPASHSCFLAKRWACSTSRSSRSLALHTLTHLHLFAAIVLSHCCTCP